MSVAQGWWNFIAFILMALALPEMLTYSVQCAPQYSSKFVIFDLFKFFICSSPKSYDSYLNHTGFCITAVMFHKFLSNINYNISIKYRSINKTITERNYRYSPISSLAYERILHAIKSPKKKKNNQPTLSICIRSKNSIKPETMQNIFYSLRFITSDYFKYNCCALQ